jgi:hypothetical protein
VYTNRLRFQSSFLPSVYQELFPLGDSGRSVTLTTQSNLCSFQDMFGAGVNTHDGQGQACGMRSLQSHDDTLICAHLSSMGLSSQREISYIAWTALKGISPALDQQEDNVISLPGQCLLLSAPQTFSTEHNALVKNMWSLNSTPPYIIITRSVRTDTKLFPSLCFYRNEATRHDLNTWRRWEK